MPFGFPETAEINIKRVGGAPKRRVKRGYQKPRRHTFLKETPTQVRTQYSVACPELHISRKVNTLGEVKTCILAIRLEIAKYPDFEESLNIENGIEIKW